MSGTAKNSADYSLIGSAVHFKKSVSQIRINVIAKADALIEGNETAIATLGRVSGYDFSKRSAVVTIVDKTVPPPPPDPDPATEKLSWTSTTSNPVGRAEAFGGNVRGYLYIFGGYSDSTFVPVTTVNRFNPTTRTWTKMNDLPEGLSQSATAISGSTMYFAGGYVANGTKQTFATRKVWKYDSTTDTYSEIDWLPEARGVGALALWNNRLFYFGGSDINRADTTKCWMLDLSLVTTSWTQIASLPVKTNRAGVAVVNNKIYLIGGQQLYDSNAIYQSGVYAYDPVNDSWSQKASLPSARSHIMASTFVRNDKIIVAGGEGVGRAKLSKVDQYDPSKNEWTSLTSLPAARFSGVGDVFGDKLLFSTGMGNTFEKTTWLGEFTAAS